MSNPWSIQIVLLKIMIFLRILYEMVYEPEYGECKLASKDV